MATQPAPNTPQSLTELAREVRERNAVRRQLVLQNIARLREINDAKRQRRR
jgi:hypothetical protein